MKSTSKLICILVLGFFSIMAGSCNPEKSPIQTPTELPKTTATKAATIPPTISPSITPTETTAPEKLNLSSSGFNAGEMIPAKYSRDGDDISPPLEWGDPPDATQSFALIIFSDPLKDGGGNWVQWIIHNIPPKTRSLDEGLMADADGYYSDGSQAFKNSWGEMQYGGPNPQHTYTFNYYFVLYALDSTLELDVIEKAMSDAGTLPWIGSSKAVLENAVDGHILAQGELVGKFKSE